MPAPHLNWSDLQRFIRDEVERGSSSATQKWLERFLKSNAVMGSQESLTLASALQRIHALQETSENKRLLFDLLDACYRAGTYQKGQDRLQDRRAKDSSMLTEVPLQRTAIKRLRRFLTKYPQHASLALGGALLDWKQRRQGKTIFPTIQGERVAISQVLDEILDCYDAALSKELHGAKRGPWLHRVQAIALLYPDHTPLDKKTSQPNARLNALLFHLVFLFRQATSRRSIRAGLGVSMPKEGNPHYSLVAVLANAALPDECAKLSEDGLFTTQQARQRVSRLQQQQVKWAPWPT